MMLFGRSAHRQARKNEPQDPTAPASKKEPPHVRGGAGTPGLQAPSQHPVLGVGLGFTIFRLPALHCGDEPAFRDSTLDAVKR